MRLIGLVSLACMLVEGAQLRRADAAIRLRARAKEPEPEPRALLSWLALDAAALAGNLKDYGATICRGAAIGYLGINAVADADDAGSEAIESSVTPQAAAATTTTPGPLGHRGGRGPQAATEADAETPPAAQC